MAFHHRFTQSSQQLAEDYARRGDFKRAIEQYRKAGDWTQAARLAADMKDEEELVRCSLMAGLGRIPEGLGDAGAEAAAELLIRQKRHELAIPLFEISWNLHRAAECALALRDPLRAARLYERAGDRLEAARCYQSAGKPREALHLLEESSKTTPGALAPPGRIDEMTVLRLDLLRQLGRDSAAAALLSSTPPSPRVATLLEQSGRYEEAIYCQLALGQTAEAARLAEKCPDRDRQLARIHLRSGRAAEAGRMFAQLGLSREAAEAYEAGQEWGHAAYRWEAAGELGRAAEAYEKAGRLSDAVRCFTAAGLPQRAAALQEQTTRRPAAPRRTVRHSKEVEAAAQHIVKGDKAQAAALLLRLQPGEPDFERGTLLLVPLLLEERFYDEALSRLQQLPTSPERLYWEGRTREALGQAEAAREGYEHTLTLAGDFLDARQRLQRLYEPAAPSSPAVTDAVSGPAGEILPGQRLAGRYDILSLIGRGGMGRVYKAHDRELGETVAIKTLLQPAREDDRHEARLLREVQICRRISHPNVVRVYDLGRFPGGLFVTMEHLEGQSLERMVAQHGPMPFDRIRDILSEIAEGLGEAHRLGVVHRDLKPANVMVTPDRVKILDFGIALLKEGDAQLTQAGLVMGSPMYMSPDQLQGREPDGRSDLYSLGLLAYVLITGLDPFPYAEPTVLALKQIREMPVDVRNYRQEAPEAWIAFLDKLIAKSPEDRFQSAQEVLDALRELPRHEDTEDASGATATMSLIGPAAAR